MLVLLGVRRNGEGTVLRYPLPPPNPVLLLRLREAWFPVGPLSPANRTPSVRG